MAKRKPNSLWGRAKATVSGKRYMVLDTDGYPVHTGRDLTKTAALKIAKEARVSGEKVRLVKSNPRKSGRSNPKRGTTVPAHVRINPRTGRIQVFVTPKVAEKLRGGKGLRVAGNPGFTLRKIGKWTIEKYKDSPTYANLKVANDWISEYPIWHDHTRSATWDYPEKVPSAVKSAVNKIYAKANKGTT